MTFIDKKEKREFIENSIIAIAIIFVGIMATIFLPANGQEDKIAITLVCAYWCPLDMGGENPNEYLIKVLNPEDYSLIGEKKFIGKQLSPLNENAIIYLDKKWIGKELQFETISLSSGKSSLDFVYIVENGQIIELSDPSP